jgi:hypothetical protein
LDDNLRCLALVVVVVMAGVAGVWGDMAYIEAPWCKEGNLKSRIDV